MEIDVARLLHEYRPVLAETFGDVRVVVNRMLAEIGPLRGLWLPLEGGSGGCDFEALFSGSTYEENYRILVRKIREYDERIPPMISSYMRLSPTTRVFVTVANPEFGGVEATGIMLTIPDIYPDLRARYITAE